MFFTKLCADLKSTSDSANINEIPGQARDDSFEGMNPGLI
ncbi:MAG: hypothetical protein JWP12_2847 [Bacteroidetes bacterium]|nr:hypothetical protein [Bacteroidota bacterium]